MEKNSEMESSSRESFKLKNALKNQLVTLFGLTEFLATVLRINGRRFTCLLALQYFGIGGLMYKYLRAMRFPYLSSTLKYNSSAVNRIWSVAFTPYVLKGFFGALSDALPLFGYNKNPYIIIAAVCSVGGCIILSAIPFDVAASYEFIPIFGFMLITLHSAVGDLMCQGKYAELMRLDNNNVGESVVFTYSMVQIAAIIVTATNAVLISNYGPTILTLISIPIIVIATFPSLVGWIPEARVSNEKRNRLDWGKIKEHRSYYIAAILSCVAGTINVIITILFPERTYLRLSLSIALLIVLCVSTYILLPRIVSKCVMFVMLAEVCYPDITPSLEGFYMGDTETCVPDGPGFSLVYYQTYMALIGMSMTLVGFVVFQRVSYKLTFRSVRVLTVSLIIIAGFVDYIIVSRYNLAIGISDELMFLLGDAIIYDLFISMATLPGALMIAKLCPPDMESTAFAILTSYSNFGATVNGFVGEWAASIGGIRTQVPCNFDSLPLIIVVCHVIMPMVVIPLALICLPDISMGNSLWEYGEMLEKRRLQRKLQLNEEASSNSLEKSGQHSADASYEDAL